MRAVSRQLSAADESDFAKRELRRPVRGAGRLRECESAEARVWWARPAGLRMDPAEVMGCIWNDRWLS
jgi:hypothetical protein